MQSTTYIKGYSLVEVLVSISVLLIAMVGPMTIASQGIKSSRFALEQNTAFFLAQEGVEAMFKLRGDAALAEVAGGGLPDAWGWYTDLYGSGEICVGIAVGDLCSFGIDFRDDLISNNIVGQCAAGSESNCLLYKNTSGNRAIYTHDSSGSGDPTEYTRIVSVSSDVADPAGSVRVEVEVQWESAVFVNTTQSVQVATQLFDITL